jgi:uncharacterized surface protein with fasciclin (FAS1) repeats
VLAADENYLVTCLQMMSVEGRGINATVLEKDIGTMNGVIHVIDRDTQTENFSILNYDTMFMLFFRDV